MTAPYYKDTAVTLYHADCLDLLAELDDCSVDAVVTDPPYGLEFMGADWDSFKTYAGGNPGMKPQGATIRATSDGQWQPGRTQGLRQKNPRCRRCGKLRLNRESGRCKCPEPMWDTRTAEGAYQYQAWCEQWAAECLRVLKPGGHLLAFGGTRTSHRLTCAVEDAGFEIRDSIMWVYGSGFPKSLDVSKAIDRAAGAERQVVGSKLGQPGYGTRNGLGSGSTFTDDGWVGVGAEHGGLDVTAPATPEAKRWAGWGTALKPSHEPIVVARKPLVGSVAANVLAHGVGGLNVDGCRVGSDERVTRGMSSLGVMHDDAWQPREVTTTAAGRWPSNVVLSHLPACNGSCEQGCAVAELDRQSGVTRDGVAGPRAGGVGAGDVYGSPGGGFSQGPNGYGGEGGASRFFPVFRYEAKADGGERPNYFRPSCDCEDAWPTTSRARATAEVTRPASSSTSRSGSATTAGPSPRGTTSTTSTTTSSTTTPPTFSSSPNSSTNESTPAVISAMVSGGSHAESAASSGLSDRPTGTSAGRDGHSTADAGGATSHRWSAQSVCGSCGAPAQREAHATVKPLDLMRWLVRLVSPPGGLVLEPFAGSGSTAEACVVEGMRCVAVEREASYLPLIVQRLAKPIQPVLL